jgi:beta-ketoacyl-acyl-carrier-protein synthase II
MDKPPQRTRVVITGLGAITPLGASLEQYWDGLLGGRSGIRRITHFDASNLPCQIAGEIPDFNVELCMDQEEARQTARACQIALAAAIQAVKDAGLQETMPDPERAGVVYGTGLAGIMRIWDCVITIHDYGPNKISPLTILSGMLHTPAFLIAHRFQCRGPNNTISTACATGTQAIGEATELIRRGAADVVITGGTDALVVDLAIAGFCGMHALPIHYNDQPDKASRPFDARREGFILSEGAAALVLEREAHARARGARVYAEVAGHASSADAYHMAVPGPDGLGPVRAMRWALEDAGLPPEAVDYINAHGSSTPLNDTIETKAIKMLFGEHAYQLAVSSTKSMIGHPMGAAGALEALACILAIHRGWIPPTINYEFPDPECDLDYVPNQARQAQVNVALSNSFGLGGQNACLVLRKYA